MKNYSRHNKKKIKIKSKHNINGVDRITEDSYTKDKWWVVFGRWCIARFGKRRKVNRL